MLSLMLIHVEMVIPGYLPTNILSKPGQPIWSISDSTCSDWNE